MLVCLGALVVSLLHLSAGWGSTHTHAGCRPIDAFVFSHLAFPPSFAHFVKVQLQRTVLQIRRDVTRGFPTSLIPLFGSYDSPSRLKLSIMLEAMNSGLNPL